MLSRLPKELLISISGYLCFKDKLNLALTCHIIKEVVVECTLFAQVSIPPNLKDTRTIIKKFKRKELHGGQVKQLKINLDNLSNQQYRKLSSIFPNVTELINASEYKLTKGSKQFHVEQSRDDYVLESLLLKWKDTIVKYDMGKSTLQLMCLLEKHTFSNLTQLVIAPWSDLKNGTKFFDCFKNAPLLQSLELFFCTVNIELLENIHNSCLRLKSFKICDSMILVKDDTRLQHISPATELSSLILEPSTMVYDRNCVFLYYITAKYKGLHHFEFFSDFELLDTHLSQPAFEAVYAQVDDLELDAEITFGAYKCEGTRILSTLPSTLKTIKMSPYLFDNIINALDNGVIQPKTLEFYYQETDSPPRTLTRTLENPKHLQYLQKTISLTTLTAGICSSLLSCKEIISVTITKLTIAIYDSDSKTKSMKLDWLLSCFPSLKSIEITASDPTIVGSKTNLVQYPRLISLRFSENINLHEELLDYVLTVAPNLTDLAWVICTDFVLHEQRPPPRASTRYRRINSRYSPFVANLSSTMHKIPDSMSHQPQTHSQPPQGNQPSTSSISPQQQQQQQTYPSRNVFYTLDLSGTKLSKLRLSTNFKGGGKFLLYIQTRRETIGFCRCAKRGNRCESDPNDDVATHCKNETPILLVKCDRTKRIVFDKYRLPLNNSKSKQ